MRIAREHLKFSCEVYQLQNSQGRAFLHEHPASAGSWKEDCMKKLLEIPGVVKRELDMCCYNLRSHDEQGEGLVQKSTSIVTNSCTIGDHLARKCCGGHRHVHLKGGRRAALAAVYTPEFCEAIVEAYKLHKKKIKKHSFSQVSGT